MSFPNANYWRMTGRLTKDPEVKAVGTDGILLCDFSIAVNLQAKKDTEKTGFCDCRAWKGIAKVISENFSKGDKIILDGQWGWDGWTDKDGKKRSRTYMTVQGVELVGNKKNDDRPKSDSHSEPSAGQAIMGAFDAHMDENITDEDIPF